jgi:hypothetical protein
MRTFKLGLMGVAIAFEFSVMPRVCARTPTTALLLASNQHRQWYSAGRVDNSRLKLAAAAVLFPASHDASR